ncbi:hypothetical protein C0Q70_11496 [Pomacea canaliculata]|uniref:Uncharacterized protein n=1 Tax=Pomacea canaliculata TaxID=400727 RepID=A0A2T7P664_POMCA|nr:hypothetical protein C0Q70_11496 [Pomacea canaliculata]
MYVTERKWREGAKSRGSFCGSPPSTTTTTTTTTKRNGQHSTVAELFSTPIWLLFCPGGRVLHEFPWVLSLP